MSKNVFVDVFCHRDTQMAKAEGWSAISNVDSFVIMNYD